jgi:hypothetical protein
MANIPNLRRSRGQKDVEAMSKADEFRQSTEEFWSKMDQKGKAGNRKPMLSHRARAVAPTGRKMKKRTKH